jgi:hypothetical protein
MNIVVFTFMNLICVEILFYMNQVKKNIIILVVILGTLCSCTNEAVDQIPVPMLKKIIETSVDGSSTITTLNYNGNKIVNIDKVDAFLEFYYTGDLITKTVEITKLSSHKNTLEYSYLEGKLTKITSSENYFINYIHNNDGSISYEKLTKDSENKVLKIHHGVLFFQNGNLIKEDQIIDNAGSEVLIKNVNELKYDNKNNPLSNILGFDKLYNYSHLISLNNATISVFSSTIKQIKDDQIISTINRLDRQYQYNSDGYPTEVVSEKIIFGGSDSKHRKSQLFYN